MRALRHQGLNAVSLLGGRVYVQRTTGAVGRDMQLIMAGQGVDFTTLEGPLPRRIEAPDVYSMDLSALPAGVSIDPPTEDGEVQPFACWINHLNEWALPGDQTIQIMMVDRDTSRVFDFEAQIDVPVGSRDMRLITYVATHRAIADVIVSVGDFATGRTSERVIPFEPGFRGGVVREGYQRISVPIDAGAEGCSVEVSIEYTGYSPDGTGHEPFLFMTQPRIARFDPSGDDGTPLHAFRGDVTGEAQASGDGWYVADLPRAPGPGDTVELAVADAQAVLWTGLEARVALVEDYGHTMVFHADRSVAGVLCVDGVPLKAVTLTAGNSDIRIPATVMDGRQHVVSIKDPTLTQTLCRAMALLPISLTPTDLLQRESTPPFPSRLFAQTPYRYESLKRHLADASAAPDAAVLHHCLSVLEGGYDRVRLEPLDFPFVDAPDVSIVMPVHNKIAVTYLGLCSLLLAHNHASYEVILVDDGSTDETAEIESFVNGITVVRHTEAQRFIRACNAGAEAARGDFIVLLNNDVEVTSGWLDALIDGFDRFDSVGIAGSKLVYPNGRLQDAGGIVWGNGNPWNYGNNDNPEAPQYSYARQVDYLSGAALMIPTFLWQQVGGLSSYLEPMYFEDTDLAFKVRDAGYSTWFIPSSVVVHYEGMTSGKDVKTGTKRFQEVNRPKFKEKWGKAFADHGIEPERPDLEKDRGIVGRVLFLDHAMARPDQDAGSHAALQEMRLVQSLGYKVTFLPLNLAYLGDYNSALHREGIETVYAPFCMSTRDYLERYGRDFDAIYITRYYVANNTLADIRRSAPQAKVLFNNADLHFLREIRSARVAGDPDKLEAARQTRDDEMAAINQADVVLSYNEMEHAVIEAYSDGAAKVMRCPWVVDLPDAVPPREGRVGLSFLGGYRHYPNIEGITWFAQQVMPHVQAQWPGLDLTIYGSGMTPEVEALAGPGITIGGYLERAEDAFDAHGIFVAPLLSGAGIKGKVLAAFANGIPVVMTSVAAEGTGARHGHDCLVADTPEAFVAEIARLQGDDALWQSLSDNARELCRQRYSFDAGHRLMRAAFASVGLYRALD